MLETDDLLNKLGRSNMFSTADQYKGSYAIALDVSTFCTPKQNHRRKVMPFGLKTAGAKYIR